MIHIIDEKTDDILAVLSEADFFNDEYYEDLKAVETFKFFMPANHSKAGFLTSRRRIVIPGEDGEFKEFILTEPYLINNTKEFYTMGSFVDLRKQKVIDPIVLDGQTPSTAGDYVLSGTRWQIGIVEFTGLMTVEFTEPLDAYEAIKTVAQLFGLELRFRVEVAGSKVVARYVDMIQRRGELSGKEVVFGKDIEGIERRETAGELVTALKCYGPVRDDGTRLMVIVEDQEAFQKWNDEGRHLWGIYEPQTENTDMTEARLRSLGQTELAKRVTPQIQYSLKTIALEHVYGYEHEKVRLGDTNRVKDEDKNPPIYLEARVLSVKRSIKNRSRKEVEYGDFIEYSKEDVQAEWKVLRAQFRERLKKAKEDALSYTEEYAYSKAVIDTKDASVYADSTIYTDAAKSQAIDAAKSDATAKANTAENNAKGYALTEAQKAQAEAIRQSALDAQARVNTAKTELEADIASKVDATWVNGQLVSKADKASTYTKTEVDNALNSKVSTTTYTTDQSGVVTRL
ncbi:phage tail spike protein, partial [Bacillus sp. MM2020_4]|uniref:phage tail spike protein n=2 Tax=Bacillaceae TaxID=186817 RepID=UPI001A99EEAE